jgi:hypothetical protein
MEAHFGRFIETGTGAQRSGDVARGDAAGLDIGSEADATQLAAGLRLGLALRETGVIDQLQGFVQALFEQAAVILQGDRRVVGEGVGRDEVAPADLRLVHAHFAGGVVDQPFQQIAGFRPAGAAIGIDRDGVGEHRLDLDIDRRGGVLAGQQRAVEICGDAGREGAEIGAHIGDGVDLQP